MSTFIVSIADTLGNQSQVIAVSAQDTAAALKKAERTLRSAGAKIAAASLRCEGSVTVFGNLDRRVGERRMG